jgi:hypothetical protein
VAAGTPEEAETIRKVADSLVAEATRRAAA